MTSVDIQTRVKSAELEGRSPEAAAFEAVATPDVRVCAWVLATALAMPAETIRSIVVAMWPEFEETAEAAVTTLMRWPFVAETNDGLLLPDAHAEEFRREFQEEEPERFASLHSQLVDIERARELEADDHERWFVRGRIAYYLAGIAADESVGEFAEVFGDPPTLERREARLWLSSLVLRQESLLGTRAREVAFFRAFRLYVAGFRDDARSSFDAVLTGTDDRYEALASHFSGLLRRDVAPERGIELLHKSIHLSEKLGLRENEIMARQSLVTGLLARGASEDLKRARQLATLNRERAEETNDPYLILWCREAEATAEWLDLTESRTQVTDHARERAPSLLATLEDVAQEARYSEPETALFAANQAACMYRDIGQPDRSLDVIRSFIHEAPLARLPRADLQRLGKTTGSLFKHSTSASFRAEIQAVLDAIDEAADGR